MEKLITEHNASADADDKVYFATYYTLYEVMSMFNIPGITPKQVEEWIQDNEDDIRETVWEHLYDAVKSGIEEEFADGE